MALDKSLVNLRIDVIERNLKEIKSVIEEGEEKFLKNYRTTLAGRHALLESIEACIDIGNHIIASMGLRRPEDYKDVFSILEENRVIPRNLSERLQKMAGFRNLLVHYYAKVDNKTVFSIMREDVKDISEFVKLVLKFMAEKA
ncbi:Uncharacterised protein [uncultured archaeon]|nr:Uncharacterised protein [uncultured archaeon]